MRIKAIALAACAALFAPGSAAAQEVDMIEVAAMLVLANNECGTKFSDAQIEAYAKMGAAGKGIYDEKAIVEAVASQYAFMKVQLDTKGDRNLFCTRSASVSASLGK